jgi:hypothetical protein
MENIPSFLGRNQSLWFGNNTKWSDLKFGFMSDRVAQLVKCLPSMPEGLNSNTSTQ